jgi:hypothetical protein
MPVYNAIAFAFDVVIGLGIAVIVYRILRRCLAKTLDEVVKIPAATTFYLRSLSIILTFVVLKEIVTGVDQKPEAKFMEYVWAVARDLSKIMESTFVILMIFVSLITIIVAVLRRTHAQQ